MREPTILKCTMPKTKARCETCNGSFGLIRHRYAYKQFCSKQCLDSYLAKTNNRLPSLNNGSTSLKTIACRTTDPADGLSGTTRSTRVHLTIDPPEPEKAD